jgi:hypothetical protein
MNNDILNLTPFEQVQLNAKLHATRMKLCHQVQILIETLEEVRKLKELPTDCDMFDETCIQIAEEEEAKIMKTLTDIATLMESYGISA